ncbi:ATP-grasp domain-containing protein [Methanobacterium alcaliphilum]|uniref:ATP-grasp domain-containing protein n=1 Tax=Methanobacterium alcaliphilum TaxID=392018 RepID=UPI00200A2156|nr:ATP-grasp domain-containing protein [Methanobacterium alcaliphilum]MCK9150902.1 ATP-grasp domain-containing protein [Methanobacterium alcaliphilum]
MNILVFEYATAVGLEDPDFLLEGRAMLEGIMDDFVSLEIHSKIYYLIADKFQKLYYANRWDKSTPLILSQDLKKWIDENISNFDACIFVAAEENMELYEFSRQIEEKGVKIIGSNASAVLKCSDKLKTFEALQGKVPVIDTHKLFLKDIQSETIPDYYKFLLEDFNSNSESKSLKNKMIIKPADGVACQGIKVVESWDDIIKVVQGIKTSLPYLLLQNFIEGESCSVSLLANGKSAYPLSLNRQKIEFKEDGLEYMGGEVPWNHPLSQKAMDVAKKVVESIEGLKGYVGVDLIISDQIYVVEINSRLTTPYVALRKLIYSNLGQLIFNASEGYLPDKIKLNGHMKFKKGNSCLKIIDV